MIFVVFSVVNNDEIDVSGNKIIVTAAEIERLSANWGGHRTSLADKGITFSVDNITTYQSVFDDGRNDN